MLAGSDGGHYIATISRGLGVDGRACGGGLKNP